MTSIRSWYQENKDFVSDAFERIAWTFAQAFLAVWLTPIVADILNGDETLSSIWESLADFSTLDTAAVAGIAAVLALIKTAIIARRIGDKHTAATLPASVSGAHLRAPKNETEGGAS